MRDERLWSAVILQAFDDARMVVPDTKPDASGPRRSELARRRRDRAEARAWLTEGGPDFCDVCVLAGLEPARVRQFAKSQLDF